MPKNRPRTPSSYKVLLALATAVIAILVSALPREIKESVIVKVLDGDTLQTIDGKKIRLIGIDCPEMHESEKLHADVRRTGHDAAMIKAMGEEAQWFTQNWVLGQKVRLEYDKQKKDKYGRTLAYVYLPFPRPALLNSPRAGYIVNIDGKKWYFLNATIVQSGYAVPMNIPPNDKHALVIKALYEQAREMRLGLWADGASMEKKSPARKKKPRRAPVKTPVLAPSL